MKRREMRTGVALHGVRLIALMALMVSWIGEVCGQDKYYYWVAFNDKEGTPFAIERPSEYLSSRAMERRIRQRISVDSMDLPVNPQYVAALQQAGLEVRHRLRWQNGVVVRTTEALPDDFVQRYEFVREVKLCKHEVDTLHVDSTKVLSVTKRLRLDDSLSGVDYYGWSYPQIEQLAGEALHKRGFEGQGIVIGVCDAGFPGVDTLSVYREMRNEGRLLAMRDFVSMGEEPGYMGNHGMHVLSLMAVDRAGVYVGTAPKATYVLCRTEDVESETPLEEYNWIAAAEYLDSLGADIITTSLGYFDYDDSTQSYSLADLDGRTAPMSRAAAIAVSRGMLLLNAAGNNGEDEFHQLNVPADVPEVLTVGAVENEGNWASFSSYGPTAAMVRKPDVVALGDGVMTVGEGGYLQIGSGTSYACPIMAGMMACLWQRYRVLNPRQLCDSVRAWGHLAVWPTDRCGYGIPDFSRATAGMLSINQESAVMRMRVYPNPATDYVVVETGEESQGGVLTVSDAKGRNLTTHAVEGGICRINTAQWPKGVYFLTFISNDGQRRSVAGFKL